MSAAVLLESVVFVMGTLLWVVVIIRTSLPTRVRHSFVQGDPVPAEDGTRSLQRKADNPDEKSMRTSCGKTISSRKLGMNDRPDSDPKLTLSRDQETFRVRL